MPLPDKSSNELNFPETGSEKRAAYDTVARTTLLTILLILQSILDHSRGMIYSFDIQQLEIANGYCEGVLVRSLPGSAIA